MDNKNEDSGQSDWGVESASSDGETESGGDIDGDATGAGEDGVSTDQKREQMFDARVWRFSSRGQKREHFWDATFSQCFSTG